MVVQDHQTYLERTPVLTNAKDASLTYTLLRHTTSPSDPVATLLNMPAEQSAEFKKAVEESRKLKAKPSDDELLQVRRKHRIGSRGHR